MASASATSIRALSMELKALNRDPVEGFLVTVPNDSDMYLWRVAIFGPPDTPYQGGYFKVGEGEGGKKGGREGEEGQARGREVCYTCKFTLFPSPLSPPHPCTSLYRQR